MSTHDAKEASSGHSEYSGHCDPLNLTILTDHGAASSKPHRVDWNVHARLVTLNPVVSNIQSSAASTEPFRHSIETVWEIDVQNHRHQRIAVYTGPECSLSKLLIALELPASSIAPPQLMLPDHEHSQFSPVLAWVTFRNQEKGVHCNQRYSNNPLLCCLINRNAICLWDVFPRNDWNSSSMLSTALFDTISHNEEPFVPQHLSIPSEGWVVPLPFDCATIFALDSGGLLLQRMEDHEDHVFYSTLSAKIASSDNEFGQHDDGFVLLGPPSTWKYRMQKPAHFPSTSPRNVPSPRQQPSPFFPSAAATTSAPDGGMVSLFTLHHPLEDVLPVAVSLDKQSPSSWSPHLAQFTDVFEQVIWIGTAEWINEFIPDELDGATKGDKSANGSAQLIVTYHTMKKRHAIWMVQDAPDPPKIPPLHEQTRSKFSRKSNSISNYGPMRDTVDLLLNDDDFPMKDSLDNNINMGLRPPPQPSQFTSRDVALADALGVRRFSVSPRPGGLRQQKQQLTVNPDTGGAFTPSSAQMPMDVSHGSAPSLGGMSGNAGPGVGNLSISSGLFTSRLANSLYPKVAVRCLYMENENKDSVTSECSRRVFLISNFSATGTLVLCLLCGDAVTLYSLLPEVASNRQVLEGEVLDLKVQLLETFLSVISAVPLHVYPAPPRYSHRKQELSMWTSDLFVLKQNGRCTLFRSNVPVLDCVLPGSIWSSRSKVVDLTDSVFDAFSLSVINDPEVETPSLIRCQLCLSFGTTSVVTESVLSCLDATLYSAEELDCEINESLIKIALLIRADCHRLFHSLHSQSLMGSPSPEELLFEVFKTIVFRILQLELWGCLVAPGKSFTTDLKPPPASDNPWETLLNSDFHSKRKSKLQLFFPSAEEYYVSATSKSNWCNCFAAVLEDSLSSIGSLSAEHYNLHITSQLSLFARVLDSIHLMYEESKLSLSNSSSHTQSLGSLLLEISELVVLLDHSESDRTRLFVDYYRNDMSEFRFNELQRLQLFLAAPGFQKKVVQGFKFIYFPKPPSILSWMLTAFNHKGDRLNISSLFCGIADWNKLNFACAKIRLVLRVFSLLDVAVDCPEHDAHIVQILLEEGFRAIADIQERFCSGVSLPLLEVLSRCRNNASRPGEQEWSSPSWTLVGRHDLGMNLRVERSCHSSFKWKLPFSTASGHISSMKDDLDDGLVELEQNAAIFFPEDNRVHEAARLLCSARPIFLRVARPVEVSDHDFERIKQKQLLVLCWRSLALPIGRGMLTIGRCSPIPAEPLPIPELCLKGRVPPTNATLNLDTSECTADMLVWPEFHNGVASGLRLFRSDDCLQTDFAVSRTWIVYNRPPSSKTPPTPSPDAADDPNQSGQPQNHSHGGFLFSLGLRGHLTLLDMSDVYEYLTQGCATTTVGVLLGMAVNKRGSCDLAVSKMLCLHIPSLIPQHFNAIDVAGVVQTAAVMGAGFLFQGSFHRMMTEFLLNEIGKRPDADINTTEREAYALACGLSLGLVNLCLGEAMDNDDRTAGLADLHIEERLIRYIVGGIDKGEADRTRETNDRFSLPHSMVGSDSEKCSTIFESALINTSVTSPGATIALGFIYMKTNNKVVADSLALPDTHFLLEFVRPDFLGLRVISRSLILWDEVDATKEWIVKQIPAVVLSSYQHMRSSAKSTFSLRSPAPGGAESQNAPEIKYDRRAIQQIYAHVVSSACFSLGLRYAGTGNPNVKEAIMERVLELHSLREASDPVSVAIRPELPILESCLGCASISLAMVLAGTGDLDALRVFKILRWRADNDSQYGIHMIFAMSIGLLFVGGGACTLGRAPEDIAALVIAFFPRFPVSSWDNQYHLQALRHVYALAVKRSELRAVDVDTKENVPITVQISTSDHLQPQEYRAPCLLQNTEHPLLKLHILSDKYFPLTLNLSGQSGVFVFFVKRRHGRGSHSGLVSSASDVHGNHSMVPKWSTCDGSPYRDAFAKYFVSISDGAPTTEDPEFLSRVLCRTHDDTVLPLYWHLRYSSPPENPSAVVQWDLRLIQTYYEQRKTSNSSLIDTELLLPYLLELMKPAVSPSNDAIT